MHKSRDLIIQTTGRRSPSVDHKTIGNQDEQHITLLGTRHKKNLDYAQTGTFNYC